VAQLGREIHRQTDREGEILVHDDGLRRILSFGSAVEQSCMLPLAPARLVYVYIQAMALAALLVPRAERALMLGLGGGSLLRGLRAALPACHIMAVERRPGVIEVARRFFALPQDAAVELICAEAAEQLAAGVEAVDLLFADLYGDSGMDRRQAAADFLRDCHRALSSSGVLALNFWSSEFADVRQVSASLAELFEGQVLYLHVQGGNIVVFACRGGVPDLDRQVFFDAAQALGACMQDTPLLRLAKNLWRQNAEVLKTGRYRHLRR
jgi:spermidine synthase